MKWQNQETPPLAPDSTKRQASTALFLQLGVTPAASSAGGEMLPCISTLPKCLALLFVASKQLVGDTTLSCPLLPLLILVLKGLFISVIDDHDLSVQSLLEFTVLPHAEEESGWETWQCFFPICLLALGGMEKSSGYLPPFLEAKEMRGNGGKPLTLL